MKEIVVYTKKRCPHCTSAKVWLKQRNYNFKEISLDIKDNVSEFIEKFPNLKTVPQIFVDSQHIGGFSDLIKSELA